MGKKQLFIIFICLLLAGCSSWKFVKEKSLLKMDRVMLNEEGPAQFLYWEIEDDKRIWESETGEVAYLQQYRDSLKMILGDEVFEDAINEEETQSLHESLMKTTEDGDRVNALLVHTGQVGKIRRINFLEAQILNYQLERFPLFGHPTEFHGFIAKNEKEQKVRVYFCSSDTGWPPRPHVLIEQLEKDMKKGWRLTYHLHNHYCEEDKNYVGILAPSLADAQYYKGLAEGFDLQKALITNGFHTVEIVQSEFHRFESH